MGVKHGVRKREGNGKVYSTEPERRRRRRRRRRRKRRRRRRRRRRGGRRRRRRRIRREEERRRRRRRRREEEEEEVVIEGVHGEELKIHAREVCGYTGMVALKRTITLKKEYMV